jgi:7,8-dihydropterin-6-yl-methyl-4-(beta-D-ribofuranosyl)aminobenzene 5'-phosphate synthase
MNDAARDLRAVEQLTIQVLVDNVTDGLSTNPSHVHSEMQVRASGGMEVLSGQAICCAHHGLSLVLTTTAGAERHTLLFDAGPEDYAVARNGDRLNVDFGAVEALVLSHGHWDHAGGMLEAVRLVREARPNGELPCYLHPGMFRQRGIRLGHGGVLRMADVPTPDDYREVQAEPIVIDHATALLDGHFFISAEIPRVTAYEKGLPGHVARDASVDDWEDDPWIMDERFMVVKLAGRGLVVFSACSHAGLINVLTETRRQFPGDPIHAVVGGFHLSGATVEPIIPETVRDLAGFDIRWIVPSHCTGWRATAALVQAFGEERVVPNAVGKRIVF